MRRLFFRHFLRLFFGLGASGDRALREPDACVGRDLEDDVVILDLAHEAEDPAERHHLVSDLDVLEQPGLRLTPATLRHHDQEVEEGDHSAEEDQGCVQAASGVSRSSVSALNVASLPSSIAVRAPAVSLSRKRRLWTVSSRSPKSSCWLTRCRMYARVNLVQAGQSQSSSSGLWSRAKRAFFRFRRPEEVSAVPVRPRRVGSTQSNMSTPRSITSRMPSGSPMPMK